MKKIFYLGWIGLLLFEAANVYFIMPMPGSQRMNSIDLAYFLYRWRWVIRILFALLLLTGLFKASWKRKWTLAIPLVLLAAVAWLINFKMAADHMFYQPEKVLMVNAAANQVDTNRLVIGIVNNGVAKAYPIRFLGYHHQVQDTIGGRAVLVTYCTVCRTGRVYEPTVNGHPEKFRLVGMDHFNAMFEDAGTRSWWRQVNGEAITGKLKGKHLPEIFSTQTSLAAWLRLYPQSLVMQADPAFEKQYDTTLNYESGKSRTALTGTDSISWRDKSWVVGVKYGASKKVYDWNRLAKERIIQDDSGAVHLLLVLANDNKSFFAFENPAGNATATISNDTLLLGTRHYTLNGKGTDTSFSLKPLPAYQEFWHSWRTFNEMPGK
jgi:hypothetical protein